MASSSTRSACCRKPAARICVAAVAAGRAALPCRRIPAPPRNRAAVQQASGGTMASSKKTASSNATSRQSVEYGDQRVERGHGGETHQTAAEGAPRLTTQQGTVVADDQNTLRAGERGPGRAGGLPLPGEDLPLRPRAHPRAGGARPRLRGARLLRELRAADRRHPGRPVLRGGPAHPGLRPVLHRGRATRAPPTWPATCAASPPSSTPGRATGTWSATTSRCSSSRTRSSSRT